MHKVLLKPTADCWQHALSFMASLPADGEKYARILSDEDSLLEFERQLIVKFKIVFLILTLFSC